MAAAIDPLRRKIDRYELTSTINPWHFFPTFVELVRQQKDGGAAVGTRTRSPRAPGWATAPSGLFISQVTTMDIRDVLPWSCSGRGRAERSRSTGAVASINPGRPGPIGGPGCGVQPLGGRRGHDMLPASARPGPIASGCRSQCRGDRTGRDGSPGAGRSCGPCQRRSAGTHRRRSRSPASSTRRDDRNSMGGEMIAAEDLQLGLGRRAPRTHLSVAQRPCRAGVIAWACRDRPPRAHWMCSQR
jgi:hypothetical protein